VSSDCWCTLFVGSWVWAVFRIPFWTISIFSNYEKQELSPSDLAVHVTGYVSLDVTLCLFLQLGRATYCVLGVLVCTVCWFKECGLYNRMLFGIIWLWSGAEWELSPSDWGAIPKGQCKRIWKFEVWSGFIRLPCTIK